MRLWKLLLLLSTVLSVLSMACGAYCVLNKTEASAHQLPQKVYTEPCLSESPMPKSKANLTINRLSRYGNFTERPAFSVQTPGNSDFIHVGVLTEKNSAAPVILTLFGKPKDHRRLTFRYFARLYDTSLPFEVVYKGRNCNDDSRCCQEIVDGDTVVIKGFSNEFVAHINELLTRQLYTM